MGSFEEEGSWEAVQDRQEREREAMHHHHKREREELHHRHEQDKEAISNQRERYKEDTKIIIKFISWWFLLITYQHISA